VYATWLKLMIGIAFGILLIWCGLAGARGGGGIGALLAAFIVPGNLQSNG